MASFANNVVHQRLYVTSIIAATGTRARMLVDQAPGGLRLPDSTLIETPGTAAPSGTPIVTRGGQRIIGGTIASTDASTKDVILYRGQVLTTQSAGATGALQAATTSSVSRATGSFITDGWTPGDTLMVFGPGPTVLGGQGTPEHSSTPAALASGGVAVQITAVAATTLTANGTPLTVESWPGCRLVRVAQVCRFTVAASAGNAAATASVALLGNSNEADINSLAAADRGLSLGPADVLIVAAQAAVSALPARLDVNAVSLLY